LIDQRYDERGAGGRSSMPAFRFVGSMLLRSGETFLYTLKAGPAGGRLRRPSSAGNDATATGELIRRKPD
jgi:hypothetical protein